MSDLKKAITYCMFTILSVTPYKPFNPFQQTNCQEQMSQTPYANSAQLQSAEIVVKIPQYSHSDTWFYMNVVEAYST